MRSDFHVVHIDFDTLEFDDWNPDDPSNCHVWATVNVGDDDGSSYFQLQICTQKAIRQIRDKRYCFMIDEFRGVSDLVAQLDDFIESHVPAHQPGDPYHTLAKYWRWEYAN